MTSLDFPRHVLLIGGSSSVGKTTVARKLAKLFAWEHIETHRVLKSDSTLQPLQGSPNVWDRSLEELRDLLINAAAAASPFLEDLVNQRNSSIVLEGERIHPELAHRLNSAHVTTSVFVVEDDAERLHRTLTGRSRSFSLLTEARRQKVAELNRAYGQWLKEQCSLLGLHSLSASPWETLMKRIVGTCELNASLGDADLPTHEQPDTLTPLLR